jgi:hypothetical protein
MFDTYAELLPEAHRLLPGGSSRKDPDDSDFVYRQATRAKALRRPARLLPAASLSNVGIYGTGQAYEALLLRMRSHPLPEARTYADLMLHELRKVIPSFLKRSTSPIAAWRGAATWPPTATAMDEVADRLFPADTPADGAPVVTLVDFDPDAEVKLVAAMLLPHTHLPETQVEAGCAPCRPTSGWR